MNFRFQKYVAPACLFLIARHATGPEGDSPLAFDSFRSFHEPQTSSRTQVLYPQFNGVTSTDCNRGWEGVDSIRRGAVEFASYKFIVLHSAPAW